MATVRRRGCAETVVGALFIALIGNCYALLELNPRYQQSTTGR